MIVVVGALPSIITTSVFTFSELFEVSIAKYLIVSVAATSIGKTYAGLLVVGVEPSVV